jgi:hypothetical protein
LNSDGGAPIRVGREAFSARSILKRKKNYIPPSLDMHSYSTKFHKDFLRAARINAGARQAPYPVFAGEMDSIRDGDPLSTRAWRKCGFESGRNVFPGTRGAEMRADVPDEYRVDVRVDKSIARGGARPVAKSMMMNALNRSNAISPGRGKHDASLTAVGYRLA